jgi:hypothetical protein
MQPCTLDQPVPRYGALLRIIRQHGHPCRAHNGAIRAAYRMGPGWAIGVILLTGDVDRDRQNVLAWLGY